MKRLLPIPLMLCAAAMAAAQQPDPVTIPPSREAFQHLIGPRHAIHIEYSKACSHRGVGLQVIVSSQGRIESARATDGDKEFYADAEAIEMRRRFKPFEQNGEPVRASITDYVEVVPLEQWGSRVPFPVPKNWDSLRFTLGHPEWNCLSCPTYSVEIRGDGDVTFHGDRAELLSRVYTHDGHRDESVLITGTHHAKLTRRDVVMLLDKFRQADFFSLKNEYSAGGSDGETINISLWVDGITKKVTDYGGLEAGMPEVVRGLEDAIDQTAGVDRWTAGNAETWPALLSEKWDFKAQSKENRQLFQSVIAHQSADLIQQFLAAGAPALAMDENGMGPLVSAAEAGDLHLVKQMMRDKGHLPSVLLNSALSASARSGNAEMVELFLSRGADVNWHPPHEDGRARGEDTVLVSAIESGDADTVRAVLEQHPVIEAKDQNGATALMRSLWPHWGGSATTSIVELLIIAGANVNARDNDGQTPIFQACQSPQSVDVLLRAGANLNSQDIGGRTPLMKCTDRGYQRSLIEAGADLSIRNQEGQTAAEQARSYGFTDEADFLEAAMKARKP